MATSILTTTPATSGGSDPAPIAWVARFTSTTPGQITGIRYYVNNAALADGRITEARVRLFDSTGGVDNLARELTNKAVTFAASVGWQEFLFNDPVDMAADHVYGISMDFVSVTANVVYGYTSGVSVPIVNENLSMEMVGFRDGSGHDGYPAGPSGTVNFFVDVIVSAPPSVTVDVGADQSVLTGATVDCDADASGTGTITYAWTKVSGPFGSFADPTAASTTFSPDGGDGVYVLRCTVTDDYGSSFDEFSLTVTDPSLHAVPDGKILDTSWTYVGGTDYLVLGDADGSTYAQSSNNPSSLPLTVTMGDIDEPAPSVPLRLRLTIDVTSGTGSVVAKLYEGTTLRSTSASQALDVGSGDVTNSIEITFPAADLTAITDWTALRIRLEVSAS